jgi:flagellar P-ring protein precursor FlgI
MDMYDTLRKSNKSTLIEKAVKDSAAISFNLLARGITLILFIAWMHSASADRIKDLTDVAGVRENQLIGFGLVVGLSATGDGDISFTNQSLRSMLARFGVNIQDVTSDLSSMAYNHITSRAKDLDLTNVAAVMVTADLPAFAKPGQRIDVTASTIGEATSLRGGTLLMTRLRGVDGEVYAMAQGNLAVGGLGAAADGSKIVVNVPTVGRVPNGATVEKMVETPFAESEYLVLNMKSRDFTTTNRVVEAINGLFGEATAEALDAVSVRVAAPDGAGERVAFLSMIEGIEVDPGEPPAKVVVNSRSGTVVISRNVRVSAAAVTHGSLMVKIAQRNEVSQPNPLTAVTEATPVQNTDITVVEEDKPMFLFEPGVELREIVDAVNMVGASPSALVAILETLKQSGSLRAELIII